VNITWVDQVTIGCGLVLLALYLIRCRVCKAKVQVSALMVCACSGGALFYGAVLIFTPFVPALQRVPMQPLHIVIAGIALSYIGWAFVRQVWATPGSISAEADQPKAAGSAPNGLAVPKAPDPVPVAAEQTKAPTTSL
jgi:hypothetical protein